MRERRLVARGPSKELLGQRTPQAMAHVESGLAKEPIWTVVALPGLELRGDETVGERSEALIVGVAGSCRQQETEVREEELGAEILEGLGDCHHQADRARDGLVAERQAALEQERHGLLEGVAIRGPGTVEQ